MSQYQAFFLDAKIGKRFCLYFAPNSDRQCRGAVIFVQPFAEEMNKSRRMFSLLARKLASHGFAVLLLDLYGCGDSEGDFAYARWEIWQSDIQLAREWLSARTLAPIHLLGLRLGALLALDLAHQFPDYFEQVVLWQPVFDGKNFLTQFYRLLLANDMLSQADSQQGGTKAIRSKLSTGLNVEIAGYTLHPSLTESIDAIHANQWSKFQQAIHWMECGNAESLPPARQQLLQLWEDHGNNVRLYQIQSPPFWTTPEITICETLLNKTLAIFDGSDR